MIRRIPIYIVRVVGVALLMGAAYCTCTVTYNGYYDQCEPAVPYDECYATRRDSESEQVAMASEIALRWIDEHPVEELSWDLGPSALMYSFTELYRVTGDERVRDYYQSWMDYHISEGYSIGRSDHCPPAIVAISLLGEAQNDNYEQVVEDTLHYLNDVAPRIDEGGISHTGVIIPRESIWVDSLFMFGMVLTRWGELSDDAMPLETMSEQVGIFADLLQHDNGLMQHAYGLPLADSDIFWARGNSWVTASLSDYLRVRVLREESDAEVERVFRDQVRGLIEAQDEETGLWWTLMNHPGEIYRETSGSAAIAYGIARGFRYGLLGEQELAAAKRAVEGVKQMIRIDEQGRPVVTGISKGTDPGPYEEYAGIPLGEDIHYGVGAVILALLETSGLPD